MMLSEAAASPEGTPVAYTGGHGEPETGWIVRAGDTMVFARFGQDPQAKAVHPRDLEFLFTADAIRARAIAGAAPGGGTGPRGASMNAGASFSNGSGAAKLAARTRPPGSPAVTTFGLMEGERYA